MSCLRALGSLLLVGGCAFVEPTEEASAPALPPAVRDHIEARRDALLLHDGGVELWRAADAHGTLLRWHTVGAPTPETHTGSLADSDPRTSRLLAPFADIDRDDVRLRYDPHPIVTVGPKQLHLDPVTRRVVRIDDQAGTWLLADHRVVDRLVLPHQLTDPDGRTTKLTGYAWPD